MGPKGCNTSYEQRQFVLYHHGKCKSQRQIANMLHLSKSTIGNNVIRYKKEDRIESIPGRGQPKELYERKERFVLRMVKNNPRISAPKLTSEMWERFGKKLNPETAKCY